MCIRDRLAYSILLTACCSSWNTLITVSIVVFEYVVVVSVPYCCGDDVGICLTSPFAPVDACSILSFVSNVVICELLVPQLEAVFCRCKNTSRISNEAIWGLLTVTVGATESMSKSKKNTIDPENIIQNYGADEVRLFILALCSP